MERLRSTEYTRQSLYRDTDDIVVRLLRRQRASRGLRVKAQNGRTRVFAFEAFGHDFVPDLPGGPILRNFLEQVVMRIKEKGETRGELIDVKSGANGPFHVLDAVVQRECKFL